MNLSISEQFIAIFLVFYFCVAIAWALWPSLNQVEKNVLIFSKLFLLVFVSWYFWPQIIAHFFPNWDDNRLGDKYGALNAIFTGLAFAGLIFTIILQQKQIKDGDKENVLRRFENTFFRLQDSYYKIIDSTELNPVRHYFGDKKMAAFQRMAFQVGTIISDGNLSWDNFTPEIVNERWPSFFDRYEDKLAHYFRVLYRIFELIDLSEIDRKDKDFYARLIRAQLTSADLTLLFFNGMTDYGENFKDYVERYALLKHFPKDSIDHNKSLLNFYDSSAYEDTTILPHERKRN